MNQAKKDVLNAENTIVYVAQNANKNSATAKKKKENKTAVLALRVTTNTLSKVQTAAEKDHRTVSSFINHLIERHFRNVR